MKSSITLILAILFALANSIECDVVVNTNVGQLRGYRERSGLFYTYFAFKGIPYAEPPIGDLRFRAPKPHQGWTGVRDAKNHGNSCPSNGFVGILSGGDEDCLFLNVYTSSVEGSKGVMVWLHGGGYLLGDGNTFLYGPELFMKENIVVVTLNNRLGALGFLSTEDRHSPGNFALKDVVLALKWVRDNIANFGGDPNKVTLSGQSAGSCTTSTLLLSPMAKGLFQQVILMSGNPLMPTLFQENPKRKAEELASRLKINTNSTEEMITILRCIHFKDIIKHEKDLLQQDNPLGLRSFDFAPSVEPLDSVDEKLLDETPINLLLKGEFQTVPMLIGNTNNEGLFNVRQLDVEPSIIKKYAENPDFYVPTSFNIFNNQSAVQEVAAIMKETYFGGQNLTSELKAEYARFQTDAGYRFANDRFLKLYAKKSEHPIYYYQFSYDGSLNFVKFILLLKSYEGACHADDIFNLFKPGFPELVLPNNHALVVRRRNVRMWSNFVKTGNPTPQTDDLISLVWPPYTLKDEEYLDINHDLSVQSRLERLKLFHDLQQKYTGHL